MVSSSLSDTQGAGKPLVCTLDISSSLTDIRPNVSLSELPQFLYESGWSAHGNIIACTQPRRVAATSVAGRVATELGSTLGDEVRFLAPYPTPAQRSIGWLYHTL